MSATVALILLMEAASDCGAAVPTAPDGRADVAQAILTVEEQPLDLSALTVAAMPSDAKPETAQSDAEPAAVQCKLVPTAIA